MLSLFDIVRRSRSPQAWQEVSKIPWDDPDFSHRMLAEHLSQAHDAASRRTAQIERQVDWIHRQVLNGQPARILDLGCGPGLYLNRLAALGHTCTGIDFGPASIDYARETARQEQSPPDFILGDLSDTQFPADCDLVMLIFGEFNTFPKDDALDILRRSHAALQAGGVILLEVHTFDSVREAGDTPATWQAAESGLFSAEPHLRLDDSHWDEGARAAIHRHYVIDASTADVTLYGSSVQAYTADEYTALLGDAGFDRSEWRPDWPGREASDEFELLLGWKS